MRNAAVPERMAGTSTRKKVFSSKATRARRAGIRSELAADAWSGKRVLLGVRSKLTDRGLDEGTCADETFHDGFGIVNAFVTNAKLLVQRENSRTETPIALHDIDLGHGRRLIV